ncbi:hypothetical protein EVAR_65454_1 [Eumeta japonica]|uniref:Uncharacterized protein n=1 Tax=Eumeta variegata TaxID=151549 RepID=A0A4C2A3Z0_EUMVA|nr:hypothetical protein EVAR_65454_1 [Eumeta japonica]
MRKSVIAAIIVCGLGGLALLTGIGVVPVAIILGFTATGIAAGSLAANAQSCFGNVQAGSIISRLTSVGMSAKCEKCRTEFSVSHSGAGDIEQHLKSENIKCRSCRCFQFFNVELFQNSNTPSSKDLDIAAAEGVWAYHTIQENHSFRSNDCEAASADIQAAAKFPDKFQEFVGREKISCLSHLQC